MSIKLKPVSGNKQQKLLARSGFYLALLYNIDCLTSVRKTAESHLCGALQNRRPVPLFIPAPRDAHRHAYTRTVSQQTASSWFHDNSKRSKRQPAEERTGVQWPGTRPTTSPCPTQHWQRGYSFVAVQGSYEVCNVLGMSESWTAQVRRCKCCQVVSDQNQFTRSTAIYK